MNPVSGSNFALVSYEKFQPGFRDEKRPGRVQARISRNKATIANRKGITFAHIIALETLNSCITAVKCDAYDVENTAGKVRRCMHPGRQINAAFITVTRLKCSYGKSSSPLISPVILWKKSVNLPLIAKEGFSTVLDAAMYPY